jgi:UPF0716 protein FxsA
MAILIALMIAVPLIELWVIIAIGSEIGAVPTILLLLAFSISGGLLVRKEGRTAWRRLTGTINSGRIPAKETADGALVVLAGALLLTPGFVTDLAGLMLLARPIRDAVRRLATVQMARRSGLGFAFTAASATGRGRSSTPRRDYDVDSVAVDVDSTALRTPRRRPD